MELFNIEKLLFKRLYVRLRVDSELWYFRRNEHDMDLKQVHLFFIGWYESSKRKPKLLSLTLLWISFQIGLKSVGKYDE